MQEKYSKTKVVKREVFDAMTTQEQDIYIGKVKGTVID